MAKVMPIIRETRKKVVQNSSGWVKIRVKSSTLFSAGFCSHSRAQVVSG